MATPGTGTVTVEMARAGAEWLWPFEVCRVARLRGLIAALPFHDDDAYRRAVVLTLAARDGRIEDPIATRAFLRWDEAVPEAVDPDDEVFAAVRHLMVPLLEAVPDEDASTDDKRRAMDVAAGTAHKLSADWGTAPPAAPARALRDGLEEAHRRIPRARPAPSGVPATVAGTAALASTIAQNAQIVQGIDRGLVPSFDAVLGQPLVAAFFADVDAALERLATDAEAVLGRIPTGWRRQVGATTRAEAAELADFRERTGMELA